MKDRQRGQEVIFQSNGPAVTVIGKRVKGLADNPVQTGYRPMLSEGMDHESARIFYFYAAF